MRRLRTAIRYVFVSFAIVQVLQGSVIAQQAAGWLGKDQPWQTPYFIIDSGHEGPTVIVTGGIHGNEPAGAHAAEQILHWPVQRGKLIVIPQVNMLGLEEKTRFVPGSTSPEKDLNRNFPSPGIADQPRGEIAVAVWKFVVSQNPDWLFDLHEGYQFNVSHKPKPGKKKSVGSTIIYSRNQTVGPMVERMLSAANATVTDSERKFVLLGGGPKRTSLASAVIQVLEKPAMILETTYNFQPLSLRTQQHRAMMAVALRQLQMIDESTQELSRSAVSEESNELNSALKSSKSPRSPEAR